MMTAITDHAYFQQLKRDGFLLDDPQSLGWAGQDWGRLITSSPLGVLRPRTVDDVADFVRLAAKYGHSVVPRGQGHSWAGQAQAPDGFVVDMRVFDAIGEVGTDSVVVGAGTRWSEILTETLPRGLTPPVVTDYLELSVGGTLAVGGIGGATQHHGMLVDNVLSLEVVTPQGEIVRCSPASNAELFDNVRAGYGQHGIIVSATIRLVPAHARARRFQLYYDDLAQFLADQRRLLAEGRFDYLEGQIKLADDGNIQFMIELASFYSDEPAVPADLAYQRGTEEIEDTTYFEFLNRLEDAEKLLREAGAWDEHCHPWVNLFLPDSATEPIVASAIKDLVLEDIGEAGFILVYPFPTDKVRAPRLELPQEPITFLFAVDREVRPEDKATTQRMLLANERVYHEAKAMGATTYLGAPVSAT